MDSLLDWAVVEIINKASLRARLASKKKLVVKFGVDPTSADLHIGHALMLRKLADFQRLGHMAVLVIGDFTARIGDPAGVNKTRPVLSDKEVASNMSSYLNQAGLILDLKKTRVVYNSQWLSPMTVSELLGFAAKISLNTLIERDDFAGRLAAKQSVGLHELLYPLTQAIDSVELKADVELGGWDQRLNLLLARELQKKSGQIPQEVFLVKPVIGLDGSRKMSSSYANFIALSESADQMFGKIMSIPDSLIIHYGELVAQLGPESVVKKLLKGKSPRDQKAFVAAKTVEIYHGATAAKKAGADFDQTFRDKKVASQLTSELSFSEESVSLINAVSEAMECSNSEAYRLISQGAVRLNGDKITQPNAEIDLKSEPLMQIGKHTWRKLARRA